MATVLLPYDEWVAGTLQNSVPANTNALRSEVLAANVISDATTAQPGSPADGDCYIIPSGRTGAQWSTFAIGSLAYYRGGTWYEFTAYEGLLKVVAGEIKLYNGSSWEVYGGGGGGGSNPPLSVEEGGVEVSADVATINFTGSGVAVTETSPGVVEVEISGGGGGGGGGDPVFPTKFVGRHIVAIDTQSISSFGLQPPSQTGTSGLASLSNASAFASRQRYNISATASTSAAVGLRAGAARYIYRSTGTGIGGFRVSMECGVGTGGSVASHRFLMGIGATSGATADIDPSTRLNFIALAYDSADTNVQIMHNDGSGTATKVDLGASFPKPSADSVNAYQLTLENVAGSGDVKYSVKEISTGNTASGTLTTNLPSVEMDIMTAMSAGGTSTAITQTFSFFTVEI